MSTILDKSIKTNTYVVILPLIKSHITMLTTKLNKLRNRTINLTRDVRGSASLNSADKSTNIVTINTTIANDNHTHSEADINASVSPVGNTIVKRDGSGNVISGGTSMTNTGYRLANGADISTLFKLPSANPWTVETRKTGTSGGVVSSVYVSGSGAHIVLGITLRNTYCYGNVFKIYT